MDMDPDQAALLQRAAACVAAVLRDESEGLQLLLDDFESPSQGADAFFLFADACVTATATVTQQPAASLVDGLVSDVSEEALLRRGADMVRALVSDDPDGRSEAADGFTDASQAMNSAFVVAVAAVRQLGERTGRGPDHWATTFAVNAARLGTNGDDPAQPPDSG